MRGRMCNLGNIMKKSIIATLVTLTCSPSVFAQELLTLNEVVVTATRTPQSRESLIADVTVIQRATIERAGQSSLVELLQLQPSLEISNNGGAGKLSNVFLRGTNANQTLILVDGMRIQSATAGTTTLENLPLAQIDRIEILRGPATSLYGQDAIGGVIQIFTKKGTAGTHAYANIGYGTYNTRRGAAGLNGKVNETSFAVNVSAEDTDGFSALNSDQANLNDDDGYQNVAASGNIAHEIETGHTIGLQFLFSNGETQFDNRFNFTDFNSRAKIKQQVVSAYTKNQLTDFWLSNVRIGFTKDKLNSFDEYGAPIVNRFDTKQTQYNWQNDFTLPVGILTLMYDRLEEGVSSNTQYNKTQRKNNAYLASYLANFGSHTLHASLRRDSNSAFGNQTTGGIGYGYRIDDHWQLATSYGKAFRAPTFNDLYFPDLFGFKTSNPDLVPEKSKNVEASLRFEGQNTQASLTLYQNKVRNLIALDDNFVPFNANSATLKGVTLTASHQYDHWQFSTSADIQSPKIDETDNLLVRRANRIGKVQVAYQADDWRIGGEMLSSSKRYNDIANQQTIAGYTLFNLTSEYQFNQAWKVQARLNNLFDKQYALAYDGNPSAGGYAYNTPGRNAFVNLKWEM
jgi:vitamin B12 transporter